MPTATCGYDLINYDQSAYDCGIPIEIGVLLSFSWGLEPFPEDCGMSSQLSYQLNLQGTDPANLIKTQADSSDTIPLANDVLSDDTYNIPGATIDFALHVIDADIDVLALIPTGGIITAKINGTTGTPFNVKKILFLDGQGVTSVFVSNPNTQPVKVRAIMAARD
jgi:hypothetical protein